MCVRLCVGVWWWWWVGGRVNVSELAAAPPAPPSPQLALLQPGHSHILNAPDRHLCDIRPAVVEESQQGPSCDNEIVRNVSMSLHTSQIWPDTRPILTCRSPRTTAEGYWSAQTPMS